MKKYSIGPYYIEFGKKPGPARGPGPRKKLITRFGKFVEKLSFLTIGIMIAGLILSCALYFSYAPITDCTNKGQLSFFNALYFSIVSFTSLGYGEIYPLHFGKAISAGEVLFGLMLVAVFIGKIASERQSALMLLVYTSEQQKRIREFEVGVTEKNKQIEAAINSGDINAITRLAGETYGFIASICGYLIVQAEQGDVAAFGNISSLRKLYRAFYDLQQNGFKIMKIYGLPEKTARTFGNIIGKLSGNAGRMQPFHREDANATNMLTMITGGGKALTKLNEDIASGALILRSETSVTPALLQKFRVRLAGVTWTRDIHRTLAAEFGVSNKLAEKCLRQLIAAGEISVPPPG